MIIVLSYLSDGSSHEIEFFPEGPDQAVSVACHLANNAVLGWCHEVYEVYDLKDMPQQIYPSIDSHKGDDDGA